jgi:hypothetical protein
MALTADMYIGRIYPEELVRKSDEWCVRYVVGATEGALTNALTIAKQRLGKRVLGMPYRTVEQHQRYLASGHNVNKYNWMPALEAKRLCIKLGYGAAPAATA